jgi:hypothetical protein
MSIIREAGALEAKDTYRKVLVIVESQLSGKHGVNEGLLPYLVLARGLES